LFEGVSTAKRELESAMFADAYRAYRDDAYRDDPATAQFSPSPVLALTRHSGSTARCRPFRHDPSRSISATGTSRAVPTDIRRLCTERKWSRSRLLFEMRRTATASGIALPATRACGAWCVRGPTATVACQQMYVQVLSDVFTVRFRGRFAGRGRADDAVHLSQVHTTTAPTVRAGLALAEVA